MLGEDWPLLLSFLPPERSSKGRGRPRLLRALTGQPQSQTKQILLKASSYGLQNVFRLLLHYTEYLQSRREALGREKNVEMSDHKSPLMQ